MDLSDLARTTGTLPNNNSLAIAASLFVVVEGSKSMQSTMGDDRFSHKYGGEIIAGTYTSVLGLLGSVITRSPLPAITAAVTVAFFCGLYFWQEERAGYEQ